MAEMEADADSKAARAEMSKSLSNAADADGDGDVDLLDLHYLDWRELLYDFYENYQECQLDEVDDILLKFRGREVELFQALEHKYIHAPYGVYAKKARKLKSRELNELDRMVYRADMVYEPSYTGVCRQPIRLMDELDFRQHMINKFDGNLGGWKRLVTEGPDGLPHKMRAGMVYYNQTWNRDSDPDDVLPDYKRGDEKRTWQIIHHYAPFHYDIDDNERYHDALDMSFYMESYAPPSPILKSDSAASSNGDGPEPDALLLPPASTRGLVQGPASISPATPLASAKPTSSVASISTKDAKASLEASDQLDMEGPLNGIHEL